MKIELLLISNKSRIKLNNSIHSSIPRWKANIAKNIQSPKLLVEGTILGHHREFSYRSHKVQYHKCVLLSLSPSKPPILVSPLNSVNFAHSQTLEVLIIQLYHTFH